MGVLAFRFGFESVMPLVLASPGKARKDHSVWACAGSPSERSSSSAKDRHAEIARLHALDDAELQYLHDLFHRRPRFEGSFDVAALAGAYIGIRRLRRSLVRSRDYRTQTRAPFTMRHLGATTAALGATTTALGAATTAAPTGRRATHPARTTPAAQ
jgi:hypothetical protein